jgi:hypothetical protein
MQNAATAPAALSATDTRNVEALTRAMGDKHLTKAQRLELAAMIGQIFDNTRG